MRFIPIGIADSKFIRPSDFSYKHYDDIQLRRTPGDKPVLIM